MGSLSRRLGVLEQIAEEARLRPYRRFAADQGLPFAEFMAGMGDPELLPNRLKAEGLTGDELLERCAAEWGMTLEELRAECEETGRRYFGP